MNLTGKQQSQKVHCKSQFYKEGAVFSEDSRKDEKEKGTFNHPTTLRSAVAGEKHKRKYKL